MTRQIRLPASLIILIVIGIPGLLLAETRVSRESYQDDAAYEEEVLRGKDLLRRRIYEDALKSFKRANEMRGKKSAECYHLMSEAYLGMEAYKNAIESADKVIDFAGDDKQLIWRAHNNKGMALQASADKKDQKKLQAAEAEFRQALSIEAAPDVVNYNLGVTLLQLNRDPEGIAALKEYIKLQPTGAYSESARKMVENPRRARENFAPDFSFTSLEGEHMTLDDLRGKVVLLDFWATWCMPCVESVPELRKLYKKFSTEQFVIIGISSDVEDGVWREFTARNKMIWPQYRDRDRRIQRAFRIRAYPTYVVIDQEGVMRFRSEGSGWERAVNLREAIEKQIKLVAKSVAAR